MRCCMHHKFWALCQCGDKTTSATVVKCRRPWRRPPGLSSSCSNNTTPFLSHNTSTITINFWPFFLSHNWRPEHSLPLIIAFGVYISWGRKQVSEQFSWVTITRHTNTHCNEDRSAVSPLSDCSSCGNSLGNSRWQRTCNPFRNQPYQPHVSIQTLEQCHKH